MIVVGIDRVDDTMGMLNPTCSSCSAPFEITDGDLAFYDSVSPVFDGKKCAIPAPTHCPDCRQQRRTAIVNERNFYTCSCGLCGKRTMTEHPPHENRTVYCRDCWFSDKWDASTYGRDADFSRPILPQIQELISVVPRMNLLAEGTNVNSDYIHYAGYAKNCYLIMHADFCEDCYYGYGFKKNTGCVDGFYNLSCQFCYDSVDVHSCYGLKGCQDCVNCSSSAFLRDCVGCKNCFLSVGLRNKEYVFENKQLTKKEYEAAMSKIDLGSYQQYQLHKSKRKEMEQGHPFKEFHGHTLENSSGDYLQKCKNTQQSFDCEDVEDGKFLYQVVTGAKNVYDIYQYGLKLQESYECSIAGTDSYHILFSHNAHNNCADLLYCWYAQSSKNCFGCANINRKQYCILNKQYTKEQYEELMPKIIDHMKANGEFGEMFPITMSPFGYNKTTAQLYYPLTKKEVEAKGFAWDDNEPAAPEVEKVIGSSALPDSIDDIPDDILNWAVTCEVTGRPFKIQKQELEFYRTQRLPIPHRSPDQRHLDRFALRNPRTFYDRTCDKCSKPIRTTYSPERGEKVYCEDCYQKAVY